MMKINRNFAAAVVLIICVIFLYGKSIYSDYVNWDDGLYVLNNQSVLQTGESGVSDFLITPQLGYPIPVTIGTYALQNMITGLDPFWFHLLNVIIFGFIAIAFYLFLRRLNLSEIWSFAAAVLFLTHPIQVEPVSWITGRKELLSALFCIFFMLMFIDREGFFSFGKSGKVIAGFVFLVLSVLSKPVAVFLPLLIFAGESARIYFRNNSGMNMWRSLKRPAFFTMLMLLPCILVIVISIINQQKVKAIDLEDPAADYFQDFFRILYHHARLVIYPFNLRPKYIINPPEFDASAEMIAGISIAASFIYALIFSFIRKSSLFFPLTFILLTYMPSSSLIPLKRQVADSYMFLPMMGICWLAACFISSIFSRDSLPNRVFRLPLLLMMIVFITFNFFISSVQTGIWKDGVSLWSYVNSFYPDSPQVCRNLGNAYIFGQRNEPEKSVIIYRECQKKFANPEFFRKNIGIALYTAKKYQEAKETFLEILKEDPEDPTALKYLNEIGRFENRHF
jgi:tetratricopeptide (TPR) repeat protein